ncbi:hypothetical protein [Polaromonas sp.]|uniref:hypothetical protein n=1 Tax=Polaromonas sp. TaxID=1869339 RepID=UPI0032643834
MGYWVNTTYIHHADVSVVADALEAVCRAEGMERISSPAQRERALVEPMQYERALHNDLWGAAIFPGAPSWTVIQTAPPEFLAERAAGAPRMRLAELCRRLPASAFQLNIYDSAGAILAEVSESGEVLISGFNTSSDAADPFEWYEERLSEEFFEAQFRLHPFQDLIAGAALGDDLADAIARQFGAQNAAFCDNLVSVDTLVCHKPFSAPGGMALYFRWSGPSRQPYSSCASWTEYQATIRDET